MIQQTINLDLIPSGVKPVIYVNQYDSQAEAFQFRLNSGGAAFSVPSGATVLIEGQKPDKTAFTFAATSFSGQNVIVDCAQQMTAVAGDTECELRIRMDTGGGTEIIGTTNFLLRVEPAALNDDSVISETMIPLIEQAVDIAADLAAYIETATNAAETATDAADTATDAATQAGIYENNMMQMYDSLETAKQNANTAATTANTAAASLSGFSASANTLSPGSSATASYNSGTKVFTFGIPTGATGASGVTTPLAGFFTMWVDPDTGDLYAASETDLSDAFYYDSETGNLYYLTEDGE